ncbi:YheC/YheD family protein [Heliobacterium chlorum]|uniref:YheC/YheD family protein n=1 Tax=Heliobacterium chlorum TaxID=2698 RepID=A0ABR7T0W1_HELCL|nr:YheC/YheD family protein [Heliobacterium chlorum]MBC9783822.1 YheC/YheD family protein [Heliobacterium chlorum]
METQRHARRLGIVAVVFSAEDINWEELTISGVILSAQRWVRKTFPLPKVIYNRIPSRKFENTSTVVECKKRFMDIPGLILFNPSYLNKWETHEHLYKEESVQSILPETRLLKQPDEIWPMLKKYRVIYLKPVNGTKGYGIYRVAVHPAGGFTFQKRRSSMNSLRAYGKQVLESKIRGLIEKKEYIAQRGLRMALINGSPFDIRLLAQKDGQGVWQITKSFGRVAPPGKFTSNLSQGGKAMGILNTLRAASTTRKRRRSAILKELNKWGIMIPELLEESTGMIFGELGLDIALDRNGKIWLLEINSKPFKRLFTEEGDPKQVRLSLERPMAFGRHLDGF